MAKNLPPLKKGWTEMTTQELKQRAIAILGEAHGGYTNGMVADMMAKLSVEESVREDYEVRLKQIEDRLNEIAPQIN